MLLSHNDTFQGPDRGALIGLATWSTKLLLTAVLAHPVDCISSYHAHTEGTALIFESEWLL